MLQKYIKYLYISARKPRDNRTGWLGVKHQITYLGLSSTEMSPSRASLAAESAAEFPLMPTWLGTQMKTIPLPSLVISVYNSKIWTCTCFAKLSFCGKMQTIKLLYNSVSWICWLFCPGKTVWDLSKLRRIAVCMRRERENPTFWLLWSSRGNR